MKRLWWPCGGVKVNPGRAPTRIGGDGIDPYVDVPHWFVAEVMRALTQHGITFDTRLAYIKRAANPPEPGQRPVLSSDPDDHLDRLVFARSADLRSVQKVIDSVPPTHWW